MKTPIAALLKPEERFPIKRISESGEVSLTLSEAKQFILSLVTICNILDHKEEAARKYQQVIAIKEIRNAA